MIFLFFYKKFLTLTIKDIKVFSYNQNKLCMRGFWPAKKVYLEFILGLIWSLLINMDLGYMESKVGLD